jgi:hypothetical protein
MMEAVNTSETSVTFYQTTKRNIPEDIFIPVAVRTWNLTFLTSALEAGEHHTEDTYKENGG